MEENVFQLPTDDTSSLYMLYNQPCMWLKERSSVLAMVFGFSRNKTSASEVVCESVEKPKIKNKRYLKTHGKERSQEVIM